MPYPNNCYSQGSYPSYSHPYVHHQNYNSHTHGYPAIGYYGGQSYGHPPYQAQGYGSPNVFSIIKTSPLTTDDDVYALNNYDTLTLESKNPEQLEIKGDKTNKKICFELKRTVVNYTTGDTATTNTNKTSGVLTLAGSSPVTTAAHIVDAAGTHPGTRVMLSRETVGTSPGILSYTIDAAAGTFAVQSSSSTDDGVVAWLLVN